MPPKYTARVIARKTTFVSAQTGNCLPTQPAEMASMLDAFKPEGERCYLWIELYRDCGIITGNTLAEIGERLWAFNDAQALGGDVSLHFLRYGGKVRVYEHF